MNDSQDRFDRRTTIHDVAREAGVSIKTVSLVARQEPNVNKKTRDAVRAVIDRLGYRPTASARGSVSARSGLLGLILENPNPAYSLDLLRGAQKAARDNGYQLVVELLDSPDIARAIVDLVVQSNLEGLIVPPPLCDNPAIMQALESLGRPFACIAPNAQPPHGFMIGMDDREAAEAMTRHLIDLGHRRIGFIMGRKGTATTARRLQGYRDAMAAAGLDTPEDLIAQGDFRLRSGLAAGALLLDRPDRPTAVFASNDDMAAGVLMAAHRLGLDAPRDLSVSGFDDSATATAMWPPLTTVRQPVPEMAAGAAQLIIDHQRAGDEDAPRCRKLPFQLIVRESTGPAPG
jgi:LacI family transcriptional regulator